MENLSIILLGIAVIMTNLSIRNIIDRLNKLENK